METSCPGPVLLELTAENSVGGSRVGKWARDTRYVAFVPGGTALLLQWSSSFQEKATYCADLAPGSCLTHRYVCVGGHRQAGDVLGQ